MCVCVYSCVCVRACVCVCVCVEDAFTTDVLEARGLVDERRA